MKTGIKWREFQRIETFPHLISKLPAGTELSTQQADNRGHRGKNHPSLMVVFIGPKRAEGSGSYLSLLHVEMTGSTFGMRLRERSINLRWKCVHSLLGGGFRAGSSRSTHNSIWVLTHRWPALFFTFPAKRSSFLFHCLMNWMNERLCLMIFYIFLIFKTSKTNNDPILLTSTVIVCLLVESSSKTQSLEQSMWTVLFITQTVVNTNT